MKTNTNTLPECVEGAEAFQRFDNAVKSLLAVPHSTIARRAKSYRKRSLKKANRPGPKPKH